MKTPSKWIKVEQGPTTAVFRYQANSSVLSVSILHREPKPVLFRRSRRLSNEVEMQ